jgi:hypothetical protein
MIDRCFFFSRKGIMSKNWQWQLRRFSHTANAIPSDRNTILVFGGFGADAASEACFINRVSQTQTSTASPSTVTTKSSTTTTAAAKSTEVLTTTSISNENDSKRGKGKGKSRTDEPHLSRGAHRRARRQQNNIPAKPPADGRLSSLAKFDVATSNWSIIDTTGDAPCAREHHCAVVTKVIDLLRSLVS